MTPFGFPVVPDVNKIDVHCFGSIAIVSYFLIPDSLIWLPFSLALLKSSNILSENFIFSSILVKGIIPLIKLYFEESLVKISRKLFSHITN